MEPEKSESKQNTSTVDVKKKQWITPEIGVYGIAKFTQAGDYPNAPNSDGITDYS
ncbi:MAG: hypothetical protein SCH68_12085 [Brevefilum sp.]|nr:hypothetical protein [Brevefilum sp.]